MKYKAKWKLEKAAPAKPVSPKASSYGKLVARVRWEYVDPVHPEFWTAFTASIHGPSLDRPSVHILFRMANGGGSCFCRFASMEALQAQVVIPQDRVERLAQGFRTAQAMRDNIQRDIRVLYATRGLPPGAGLYRTDTGECIMEPPAAYLPAQMVDP